MQFATTRRAALPRAVRQWMAALAVVIAIVSAGFPWGSRAAPSAVVRPTVVVIDRFFAEPSNWTAVTRRLLAKGYPVVVVADSFPNLADRLDAIEGNVILVSHSRAGDDVGRAVTAKGKVRALVYVGGVPDEREGALTQRAMAEAAFNERAASAAWKEIPSWFVYGSRDQNIAPAMRAFLQRRTDAKRAVEIKGASHSVMRRHPDVLVRVIEAASALTAR
jgi:pimeloyl-ACP methyl ester carboxylesterase